MKKRNQVLESVNVNEVIHPKGMKSLTVASPCEEKNSGYWYCVNHDKSFQNQLQKDLHIHDGKHRLAWMCWLHGLEKP